MIMIEGSVLFQVEHSRPAAKKVEEDSSRDENSYEEEEKAKTAVKPILK